MTTETLSARAGDFLLGDPGTISMEVVTIAAGADLQAGMVLGKITASGKYAPYDNTAADGTQTAAGILLDNTEAASADQVATMVARLAEVQTDKLLWDAANNEAAQTAGLADMAASYIIAR